QPDGSSYQYQYCPYFGMPINISLLNRRGSTIGNLTIEKTPTKYEFFSNPELTYLTSTGEKISYRFVLYGKHSRAILSEVTPPHGPQVKYQYMEFHLHEKKQKLCMKEFPDQRILLIDYDREGKVTKLTSPAGENNQLVATYTFS